MIEINASNTKGLIGKYLATYNNIKCFKGDVYDYAKWYKDFIANIDNPNLVLAFDIEARKLYPRNNNITHFALSYKHNDIYYNYCFVVRDLDKDLKARVFNSLNKFKCKILLHNAYYDIGTIKFLHNVDVKWDFDTYILFHTLMSHRAKDDSDDFGDSEEDRGLGLKDFTRDYLPYGNYEEELEKEKKRICKELGVSVKQFTYDLFSDEIIAPYNCFDVLCTLQAFEIGLDLFKAYVKDLGLNKLAQIIKTKKATMDIYIKAFCRGVKIDYDKVEELGIQFKETRDRTEKAFLNAFKTEIEWCERLHRVKEYDKILNESMVDYLSHTAQKGSKKGKTKKEEDGKHYYTKGIELTPIQSRNLLKKTEFSMTSTDKKTTLFVEVMGLKPDDKGTSRYEPIILGEKEDIFSKCFGYKLNDTTGKRERVLMTPKTDRKYLEQYVNQHPHIQDLLDFGKCKTALNNFLGVEKTEEDKKTIDGTTLAELTDKGQFPYVYPSYNILGTITNRCTCNTPNLQQIPARGVLAPLKECFSAREGHKFYYADYSSAEIVILTAIINSKRFSEAIHKGWDLHSMNVWFMQRNKVLTQAPEFQEMWDSCKTDDDYKNFYGAIKEKFEKTLRYATKSATFSLAYGAGEQGLSKNIGISVEDAKELIDDYMRANPEMKKYFDNQHRKAKEQGFITNPFGAFLMMPDVPNENKKPDYNTKKKIEKQKKKALNFPIQSSNAFLLYEGLIKADKMIKDKGLEDKMHFMFSVYDSFCYEVSDDVPQEEVLDILEKSFICYLNDDYLGIDIEIGTSWGNTEHIKRPKRTKEEVQVYDFREF